MNSCSVNVWLLRKGKQPTFVCECKKAKVWGSKSIDQLETMRKWINVSFSLRDCMHAKNEQYWNANKNRKNDATTKFNSTNLSAFSEHHNSLISFSSPNVIRHCLVKTMQKVIIFADPRFLLHSGCWYYMTSKKSETANLCVFMRNSAVTSQLSNGALRERLRTLSSNMVPKVHMLHQKL